MKQSTLTRLYAIAAMALLAIASFVLAIFSPKFVFRSPDDLRIGFIGSSPAALAASRDINASISSMTGALQPRPPLVVGHAAAPVAAPHWKEAFDSMYNSGVRAFFGFGDDDVLQAAEHAASKRERCLIVSASATTSLAPSNVALADFDGAAYARAFLEVINATNPTGKVLHVIPVMRSDEVDTAFHEALVDSVKSRFSNDIKLTPPGKLLNVLCTLS